ncbi:MAG: ParB/RepB/Spo0J family partition protein [Flavobacterium sp.]|nr:MAG: ParB/RepB/Spo0J family partition protein [Flavobacterium sp.]
MKTTRFLTRESKMEKNARKVSKANKHEASQLEIMKNLSRMGSKSISSEESNSNDRSYRSEPYQDLIEERHEHRRGATTRDQSMEKSFSAENAKVGNAQNENKKPETAEEWFDKLNDQIAKMKLKQTKELMVKNVPIEFIDTTENTRKTIDIDGDEFLDLKKSIQKDGILQTPIVTIGRSEKTPILLVAGARRILAWSVLGSKTVDVIFRIFDSEEQISRARIDENEKRSNLSPMDRAESFKEHIDKYKLTPSEFAEFMHADRSHIHYIIKLASFPEDVKAIIRSKRFTQAECVKLAKFRLTEEELREKVLARAGEKVKPRDYVKTSDRVAARDKYFTENNFTQDQVTVVIKFLQDFNIKSFI